MKYVKNNLLNKDILVCCPVHVFTTFTDDRPCLEVKKKKLTSFQSLNSNSSRPSFSADIRFIYALFLINI